MISKEDLLKLLSLPEGSDLAAVREKVRSLENRELDAVAAQAVMGWRLVKEDAPHCFGDFHISQWGVADANRVLKYFCNDLRDAAALAPKIMEMGLKADFALELTEIATGPIQHDSGLALDETTFTDDEVFTLVNATARQRTEASVMAVAGRVMQC